MFSRQLSPGHNSSDRGLSRYFSPIIEIEFVCYLVMSAQRSCVVSLFQPGSRDRVLSRYVSPVVEIVCCLVMSAQ